ncbi:MAG: FeoB-associated Cys-rich membrane protein [Clostridia bacterium]|nr:FeoB-associated Cys-rich membrane protein [Clostridia bacterium]
MGTLIVAILIAAAVGLAAVRIVKNKKEGKCSCGGSCGCCPMSGQCHKGPKGNEAYRDLENKEKTE